MAGQVFLVTPVRAEVDVDFTAGPAGADIAHLPEVILPAERQNPFRRYRCHFAPKPGRFLIGFEPVLFVAGKLTDDSLRESWLRSVRVNREIVEDWSSLPMGWKDAGQRMEAAA